MLITFRTRAHGDVTYMGDVAQDLLKLMGRRGTVPSAMYAEDVPTALAKLKTAVAADRSSDFGDNRQQSNETADSDDAHVSLSQRALPLIQLLEAAQEESVPVMWES